MKDIETKIILILAILFLLSGCSGPYQCGIDDTREKAIKAGVAYWDCDKKTAYCKFKWKKCKNEKSGQHRIKGEDR